MKAVVVQPQTSSTVIFVLHQDWEKQDSVPKSLERQDLADVSSSKLIRSREFCILTNSRMPTMFQHE